MFSLVCCCKKKEAATTNNNNNAVIFYKHRYACERPLALFLASFSWCGACVGPTRGYASLGLVLVTMTVCCLLGYNNSFIVGNNNSFIVGNNNSLLLGSNTESVCCCVVCYNHTHDKNGHNGCSGYKANNKPTNQQTSTNQQNNKSTTLGQQATNKPTNVKLLCAQGA